MVLARGWPFKTLVFQCSSSTSFLSLSNRILLSKPSSNKSHLPSFLGLPRTLCQKAPPFLRTGRSFKNAIRRVFNALRKSFLGMLGWNCDTSARSWSPSKAGLGRFSPASSSPSKACGTFWLFIRLLLLWMMNWGDFLWIRNPGDLLWTMNSLFPYLDDERLLGDLFNLVWPTFLMNLEDSWVIVDWGISLPIFFKTNLVSISV